MKTYDIVFATPGAMMTSEYVKSLAETFAVLSEKNISFKYINFQAPYIRAARDMIMNLGMYEDLENNVPFLNQFDYKKIMWIDSDISWNPEHVLKLYESEKEVVCGLYRMTNGNVSVSFNGSDIAKPEDIPRDSVVKILSCGFGFVSISKGVFERMTKPWFDSETFKVADKETCVIGEDTSWCMRAYMQGIDIWLDSSVDVIHNKTIGLKVFD